MKMWNKIKKDAEAISPVVATLMLVLVAVASATAFYLWQSGWQSSVQDNIGDGVGVQTSLVVAGSSTVYEFMAPAADAFMLANPNYVVSVQNVGSGAGIESIGQKKCDIGMASRALKTTEADAYPDLVQTTIAYDGLVLIMKTGGHGITASDLKNLTKADVLGIFANTIATWGDLRVALDPSWAGTDDAPIVTYSRADESGTEDGVAEKMMPSGNKDFFKIKTTDKTATGNQGMVDAIAADANAIGFASYGMANLAKTTITAFGFEGRMATDKGIKAHELGLTITGVNNYNATRPLVILTNDMPNGDAKVFIDFCLEPTKNIEFCTDGGFISYTLNLY